MVVMDAAYLMSEIGDLWRAVKKGSREYKDGQEAYRLFRLHWARERDLLCFKKLSEHHYKVWIPEQPNEHVDFWPRTSAIRWRGESYKGWVQLMKILGIPREQWTMPKEDE